MIELILESLGWFSLGFGLVHYGPIAYKKLKTRRLEKQPSWEELDRKANEELYLLDPALAIELGYEPPPLNTVGGAVTGARHAAAAQLLAGGGGSGMVVMSKGSFASDLDKQKLVQDMLRVKQSGVMRSGMMEQALGQMNLSHHHLCIPGCCYTSCQIRQMNEAAMNAQQNVLANRSPYGDILGALGIPAKKKPLG